MYKYRITSKIDPQTGDMMFGGAFEIESNIDLTETKNRPLLCIRLMPELDKIGIENITPRDLEESNLLDIQKVSDFIESDIPTSTEQKESIISQPEDENNPAESAWESWGYNSRR